ncbi:MAG: class I SAM-dependent methyltransferase [Anaerolineales bacterium]
MKTEIANEGKTCKPRYIPNNEKLTVEQLQGAYDELAGAYEKRVWFDQSILGVARQRKRLMSKAQGKVLDVACGTGLNFPFFNSASEITAIDLSERMLDIARQKAVSLNLKIQTQVMDAEKLDFADGSFDTVTSSLSTCTFPDPIQALREMKRVCRAGGLILLLEHGHSSLPWLANLQDRNVLSHYQQNAGCRWNQEPLKLIQQAGLNILESRRFGLGMFHAVTATP